MTEPILEVDEAWMARAIEQARLSRPSPNPPVGAVVLDRDGQLVAEAHHVRAGEAHAEEAALTLAGERAAGGTLYVTLEPCNHRGRTPPCVDAVLRSKVARVVVGCHDPNPHVEGGGADRLRESGLEVVVGAGGADVQALVVPWTTFITTGIPHVSLKLALSLDGRIATRTGASRWVTGPEARAKVQELRARNDAVAVGVGTALADDPRLTIRDPDVMVAQGAPMRRIVFDTRLRTPLHSKLVQTASEVPTWILTGNDAPSPGEQALVDAGCEVFRVPLGAGGRVDVGVALRTLAKAGIVSLLVEGGSELAGSLLAARVVHEIHAFIAPILLGPRGRPGAVDWAGPSSPADAPRILEPTWELCGRDAYVSGPVEFPEKTAT